MMISAYSVSKDVRNRDLIQFWNCGAYLFEDLLKNPRQRKLTYTDTLLFEQKSDL